MAFADRAVSIRTAIVANDQIARDTWRMRIEAPQIARSMLPGQFVMVRLADCNDPLIGRALAIYDRFGEPGQWRGIDLAYVVKWKFTKALSNFKVGQEVDVWGPLGNAFSTEPVDRLILVAGGVGQTPMLVAGKEALGFESFGNGSRPFGYAKRVTLCYGARSADLLACVSDFVDVGMDVQVSTDDGSIGEPKRVTDKLNEVLNRATSSHESVRIACCGPEPMMEAVSEIANRQRLACEVSLETPMACGIGICFTCVARVALADGQWDYKRTCIEGPIFDAAKIVWQG